MPVETSRQLCNPGCHCVYAYRSLPVDICRFISFIHIYTYTYISVYPGRDSQRFPSSWLTSPLQVSGRSLRSQARNEEGPGYPRGWRFRLRTTCRLIPYITFFWSLHVGLGIHKTITIKLGTLTKEYGIQPTRSILKQLELLTTGGTWTRALFAQ